MSKHDDLARITAACAQLSQIGDEVNACIAQTIETLTAAGACAFVRMPISGDGKEIIGWDIGFGKSISAKVWTFLAWPPSPTSPPLDLLCAPLLIRINARKQLSSIIAEIASRMEEIAAIHGKQRP